MPLAGPGRIFDGMRDKRVPPPPRPTHIERQAKTIRDIEKRCAGLQERLEYTTDPERVAVIEQQLRTLEEGRTAPFEALAGWYQGLPDAARAEHEDFARRCTVGGVEALLAARPAAG
jgi:hypothetical protein